MMLFLPTTRQSIKACLLLLVLGLISINVLHRDRLALHPVVLLWTLFMAATGLAFMLLGLANGAPGALRMGTVYVLWPLVNLILIAGAATEKVLNGICRILIAAAIVIGLYGIIFVIYIAGWIPDFLYVPIEPSQAVGLYKGYVEMNLHALASLLFLVPFLVAALLTWPLDRPILVSRFWLWFALLLGSTVTLLSGRRGLLLVVALSPGIALFFRAFLPSSGRWMRRKLVLRFILGLGIGLVSLTIYLSSVFDFSFHTIVEMFAAGWDFVAGDESSLGRRDQFIALLEEWSERPLFGAGHGASAAGSIRDADMPWAYELYYLALLFHTGILGFLAYTAGVIWIFWMGIKIIRLGNQLSLYMVPVLVGTSCFLIANGTNPYLVKFDYMWIIFLPVAFINYWLLNSEKEVNVNGSSEVFP
jgi:O-antigen ligase